MAIYKCKMCGADLNLKEGDKITTCDYCGTKQTISTINDDKILKLISRGNAYRLAGDFDKAQVIFEQLISEKEDAENYWNLLLCKYGITYEDDYDGKKKPTINRMSMDSILEDPDYKKVIETSDVITKQTYIEQAKEISKIQEEIINIAKKEKPYDIFICYKETDEFGDRTKDSIKAQEIYSLLEKEGYKVFLSRVTLSSVAGHAYEPYIYSALYSSRIMILISSNIDYINSTWVKNEWSRFLNMKRKDSSKILIPCIFDMDPYDLPKELRDLQALDMNKLGSAQDLILGVNKAFNKNNKEANQLNQNNDESNYLKRAMLFYQDNDIENTINYCNKTLDLNAENPYAYELLMFIDFHCGVKGINKGYVDIFDNGNYIKMIGFANNELKEKYKKIRESYDLNMKQEYLKSLIYFYSLYLKNEKGFFEFDDEDLSKFSQLFKELKQSETINKYQDFESFIHEFEIWFSKIHRVRYFELFNIPIVKFYYDVDYISKNGLNSDSNNLLFYEKYPHYVALFDNKLIVRTLQNDNFIEPFKSSHCCVSVLESGFISSFRNTPYSYVEFQFSPEQIKKLKVLIFYKGIFNNCRNAVCIETTIDHGNFGFNIKSDDESKRLVNIIESFSGVKAEYDITEEANYNKKQGCYIATCVYGSYDCPQVWTLRRYRDYKLHKWRYGRLFIRLYYAISPSLVKWFGMKNWFKKIWKTKLDKMVAKYKGLGYEDTPYKDLY